MDNHIGEKKETRVSELSFAAFLKINGLEMISMKKPSSNRSDDYYFIFDDSDNRISRLKIDFYNSDFRKFDDEIRALKKMLKESRR